MRSLMHLVLVVLLIIGLTVSVFHVQPVKAINTIRILSDGSIDPPEAPISTSDKITYTLTANITGSIIIERNNTIIDGEAHLVRGDGSGNGFKLYGVSNVVVKNANIKSFTYGIYIESATSIVTQENNITTNSYDGIGLFYVSDSIITGNRITWNGYDGIEMYDSSYNNITGNYIVSNGWFGVGIYYSSNSIVSENMVRDNYNGIELYSSSSSVFHNDFINHTAQVSTVETVAVWDDGYPSGGNYWSDYSGVDSNGDGIGDTPYPIDENNQDRYPLMKPWTNIAISKITLSKNIVGQGYASYIYVYVQNQGWNTETIDITIYANTTPIIQEQMTLASRSSVDATLVWDSSSLSKGNYTISAYAMPVPGETDTVDNNCTDGIVYVGIPGDFNGDGAVDGSDFFILLQAWGTSPPSNPLADPNDDGTVDGSDFFILLQNWGQSDP